MKDYTQGFLKANTIGGQHGNHYVYWIPIKIFNELKINRWAFNRPPDADRVSEIHQHMKSSKRMDGIIYLAWINNELVCYESNHRREALEGIDNIADILVDIMWDATDDSVKEEFVRLNKAVSVPSLYIDVTSADYKSKLLTVVNDFCKSYKTHISLAGKPNRPNFNRDTLQEEFHRVISEQNISIEMFVTKLTEYNKRLMLKDKSKLSKAVVDKCTASGLWLFAWSSKLDNSQFV